MRGTWKRTVFAACSMLVAGTFYTVMSAEFPLPGPDHETFATEGIWTWYGEPKAIYYNGEEEKTYVAYFRSLTNPGSVEIGAYDHATGIIDTFALKTNFGYDDHHHPSILVRNDGHIMAFYCKHYGSAMYMRISSNPEDISSWEAEQTIFSGSCTYPNIIQLSDEGENGNRIYCFFRGPSVTDYDAGQPHFVYSDDGGQSWSSAVRYFVASRQLGTTEGTRPYVKYDSNHKDRIVILIEHNNRNNGPQRAYYLCYQSGSFYKSDGTLIKTMDQVISGDPITSSDVEIVYEPADPQLEEYPGLTGLKGTGWDIAIGQDGNPVFVFDIFNPDGTNHRYYYYRYNGTSWEKTFLINSGGSMADDPGESGFAGGVTLDHENPNIVYLSAQVNGSFELFRYETDDFGQSWSSVQITENSGTEKNTRPCVPRGYTDGKIGVVWNCGTHYSWGGPFSQDVKMFDYEATAVQSGQARAVVSNRGDLRIRGSSLTFTLVFPSVSRLSVYDMRGREALDLTGSVRAMSGGSHTLSLESTGLPHGVYIARLFDGLRECSNELILKE